jgi:hypothetical protein
MGHRVAVDYLRLAQSHLKRVLGAWREPTDWADLTIYGFLCLEAAVMTAAHHLAWSVKPSHRDKAEAAERLTRDQGLPEIYDLLYALNAARKAASYGDLAFPELDAEHIAREIENYVNAVKQLVGTHTMIK